MVPEAAAERDDITGRCRGGSIVFEFTVFGESGEELGGNVGGKPRIFQVGASEMLPALESQLVHMEEGERRSIVLPPEAAYGAFGEGALREFPLESIPEEARAVGRKVMGRAPDGSEDMFDVVAIRGDTAVVDMNHPLAGRELRFELKVLRKNPLQS
jgi:FKBP-type peptidyl-prolyl cis-trans isomerase 2